jgi:RNA polymerase sigma factor (sigma-70 family)
MMDDRRGQARARLEFERFVADSADKLLRAAYLITWDVADAEDLVQECLFRVARRWPRVCKMDHPTAYARTVLVHLALDEGKRRTRRRAELQHHGAVAFAEHQDDAAVRVLGRVEASADLMGALGELPPRQRVALVLRYFEDLSEAEAAEADIVATVADGWFVAWWPGPTDATSAQVTKPSGTTSEPLVPLSQMGTKFPLGQAGSTSGVPIAPPGTAGTCTTGTTSSTSSGPNANCMSTNGTGGSGSSVIGNSGNSGAAGSTGGTGPGPTTKSSL